MYSVQWWNCAASLHAAKRKERRQRRESKDKSLGKVRGFYSGYLRLIFLSFTLGRFEKPQVIFCRRQFFIFFPQLNNLK